MSNQIEVINKVTNHYTKEAALIRQKFPEAKIYDVTVDGGNAKFDPASVMDHWIQVPGMDRDRGFSLKAIWEGLKVFSHKDHDPSWWRDDRKKDKVRGCKSYGKLLGIRIGDEVVGIDKAKEVFEEMYEKMVRKEFPRTLENLRKDSLTKVVVLLDYAEGDPRKWLDHAAIMKRMIEEDQTEHGLAA